MSFLRLEDYTPEMISTIIKNMGKNYWWTRYSFAFRVANVDGSFMVDCDVRKIESLGVKRSYARRIVNEFNFIQEITM